MKIQNSKFKVQSYSSKLKVNRDNFVEQIVDGKMRLHELPEGMTALQKAEVRRKAIEKITKTNLLNIGKFSFDAEVVSSRNCENLIGGVQIPLGIAGPILIKGKYAKGNFYLPLATTEGALIASVSRGCKAINLAGGVKTEAINIGMTRAPVFKIKSKIKNQKSKTKDFLNWVKENFNKIAEICEGMSKHLKLIDIEPFTFEEAVFLRFRFDTGLAMGMNMVTIAVAKAVEFIEKNTGAKCVALTGNLCVDKKPSFLNYEKGRGKKSISEIIIKKDIVEEVLKTTVNDFYEVYRLKVVIGSKIARTIGANAHIANIIAAIFAACGQDLAHIVEASIGDTKCEIVNKSDLKITVTLPDLPIGVIGGGTGLATQKECLLLMGLFGNNENDSLKFAEIIGAAVLAGEISLIAALASHDLARAHQKLGRGK